jgi:D-hexose-6-phosphate mutarotase
MTTAQALNTEFGIAGQLAFRDDPGGLVIAAVNNAHATASICLQGAHLMTWQPKGQAEPVIWLSRDAKLAPGKSIRGGVPVCWPWFGPHPGDKNLPAHGWVRTLPWSVVAASCDDDGATRLSFRPVIDAATSARFPANSWFKLTMVIGESLRLELTTSNTASYDYTQTTSLVIEEALHTYFRIGDIAAVRLSGLDGCTYVDRVEGGARKQQQGDVRFTGETDRVYIGTRAECMIEDDQLKRRIRIAKTASDSTVVWTPWTDKAAKMGDLGQPDGWREMLCVETANVAGDAVNIPAGGDHTMVAEYRVEAM